MKVTVDRMPHSVVTLDIAADPEEFAQAVDKTLRQVSREAEIPGFRRGRAPRHIIERMIGRDAIVAEAGRNMMDDLYRQALEEQDLQPISEPKVDIVQEEPLAFRVLVEVFPTVELGDYRSVSVEPREVELDEDEVEEEIEALRKNRAEWLDVEEERKPHDGDQVTIDLEVYEGDEPFQEPSRDATFVLGESTLFEPIVEAIKTMTPGESTELTLAFEEDDTSVRKALRGKTLRYEITLKGIQERDLPELTDEFAAEIGEFETVEELREAVREDVLRRHAMEARSEVVNEITERIVELSEVQVPQTMIDSELDDQLTQLRTRLAQQGIPFDDYLLANDQTEDELRQSLAETAEERVRNTLVLQEVAKAENMEVTEEDLDAEIEKLVAGRPNPDQLRQLYRSEYFIGMLQNEVHDRKLIDLVIEIGTDGRGAITGAGAELLEQDEAAALAPAEEESEPAVVPASEAVAAAGPVAGAEGEDEAGGPEAATADADEADEQDDDEAAEEPEAEAANEDESDDENNDN